MKRSNVGYLKIVKKKRAPFLFFKETRSWHKRYKIEKKEPKKKSIPSDSTQVHILSETIISTSTTTMKKKEKREDELPLAARGEGEGRAKEEQALYTYAAAIERQARGRLKRRDRTKNKSSNILRCLSPSLWIASSFFFF